MQRCSGWRGVYPRPHGEADTRWSPTRSPCGLSPPTRGSPGPAPVLGRTLGSIPAHTGKPGSSLWGLVAGRVYPRPHGEADSSQAEDVEQLGLSPPTRGSLEPAVHGRQARRSIPAHTGKPASRTAGPASTRVYPRPHGEAYRTACEFACAYGLSPPTRGSPCGPRPAPRCRRSIPAHTGKPRPSCRPSTPYGVYPRPHGEAQGIRGTYRWIRGLSPPTRGSLWSGLEHRAIPGSIPAHTGKPGAYRCSLPLAAVYPRPHGEAVYVTHPGKTAQGLSPPTRGSRRGGTAPGVALWSIPAHTGKPWWRPHGDTLNGVYPRPHGEAVSRSWSGRPGRGLSPPTRGSPGNRRAHVLQPRSIPAHTGKPAARRGTAAR